MTAVDLDWGTIMEALPEETPQRELIPPDTYTVKVSKAEAGVSKAGNAKIELTFLVDDGQYKGKPVWGRINFVPTSPNSMAITVDQLAQFGVTRQWLATNSPKTEQIARRLVGERVTVKVTHREWEGTMYYEVKGFKAVAKDDGDPF